MKDISDLPYNAASIIAIAEVTADTVRYSCDCECPTIIIEFDAGFAQHITARLTLLGEIEQMEALYEAIGHALEDAREARERGEMVKVESAQCIVQREAMKADYEERQARESAGGN